MRLLLGKSALVLVLTLTLCSLCNPGRRWPFGSWQLTASSKREITASSDMEKAKLVTEALETDAKTTESAKAEAAMLDTDALMKRNAELMAKLKVTATRADTTKLEVTMAALEERKAEADAIRESLTRDELLRRNKALMSKVEGRTATRADMEKAKLVTEALETRTTALGGIAAETDLAALMKRNAELRKSLHCGTSMRADEEALRAVMKRKEELEEGLRATKAKEAAVALEKVRPCPVAAFSISSPLLTRLRFVCVSFGLVRRRARTCD